jgi:hypothetical protein
MRGSLQEWAEQQGGWAYLTDSSDRWMNRLPGGHLGTVTEWRVTQEATGVVDGHEVVIADFF